MTTDGSVVLADGRTLAYEDTGDPAGFPVILAHGFPGSRLEARVIGAAAAAAGVRLVCPDRPGFGHSDPHLVRQIGDWPADIVALADHCEIGRFAVVGFSAGGPYALACVALLPERVTACAIVSSPGPLDRPGSTAGMSAINKLVFGAGHRAPLIASLFVRLIARSTRAEPAIVARRMARGMAVPDQRILGTPPIGPAYGAAIREAFRQGPSGPTLDARLLGGPWSFSVDRIRASGIVWHGTEDRNVPVSMARRQAASIPGCRLELIEGAGHLLFLEHAEAILTELRSAASG